jgi:hypothetical protein
LVVISINRGLVLFTKHLIICAAVISFEFARESAVVSQAYGPTPY